MSDNSGNNRDESMSAAAFMELLSHDPEYQARIAQKDAESSERAKRLTEAERPIVKELREAGLEVDSVWDLVNTSTPYPVALPILIRHFKHGGYPSHIMNGLGRALAVKPSIEYWEDLLLIYQRADDWMEREGAAVALAACATSEQVSDVRTLLDDSRRGTEAVLFLRTLKRIGGKGWRDLVAPYAEVDLYKREVRAMMR